MSNLKIEEYEYFSEGRLFSIFFIFHFLNNVFCLIFEINSLNAVNVLKFYAKPKNVPIINFLDFSYFVRG